MRRIIIVFWVTLIFLGLERGFSRTTQAQEAVAASPKPSITQTNEQGLRLVWTLPAYQLTTTTVDGLRYSQPQLPGLNSSSQPGYPQLPVYSGFIGLPARGEARLRIVDVEQETVNLPFPPLPAPVPEPVHLSLADPATLASGGQSSRRPDPTAYRLNTYYPDALAHLDRPEQIRGHRVARLIINPIRINPTTGEMVVIRFLRLEITFTQPDPPAVGPDRRQTRLDPVARAMAPALLNPQAVNWSTVARPSALPKATAQSSPQNAASTKVLVTGSGIYALTYSDLQAAGLPVATFDPRTLKLSHGYPRQEVAILVEGEEDGIFEANDRVLFYAEADFNRFADYDVYFLDYGGTNGTRMGSRSGDPANLPLGTAWRRGVAEENQFYDSLYAGRDGDRWYWDKLRQPDQPAATFSIWLDAPLTTGPNATLTLWLQGYTSHNLIKPDHRVAVSVNGLALGEISWDGAKAIERTFTLPAVTLRAGVNQVGLSLPGTGTILEGTWVDALAIRYPSNRANGAQIHFTGQVGQYAYALSGLTEAAVAVYDIMEPETPQRVVNYSRSGDTLTVGDATTATAGYLVVPEQALKSPLALQPAKTFADPPEGADYIVITHPNFSGVVAPLAAHRAAGGLRVITVDVEAIYDRFGTGRIEPEAIRTFLQYAYNTWPAPAPLYVLLVGDGSYDFRNYTGWNPQMFIPPYLAQVDPWLGETASDNYYVTVAGDDSLPDLLIGRLAVNTVAEARTVVQKIVAYETDPVPGGWNARHLFVADNPDYAGDFHVHAKQAYDKLTPPFSGRRFYYANEAAAEAYVYTDVETLRAAFLADFNYGAGLVTFHGHSSWHQWAHEAFFRWSLNPSENDVTTLHNGSRLPFVSQMTCFTGFFHHPEYPTMDESLLRLAGGGAIAVWGSTGLGVATGHQSLQGGLYEALFDQGETNLGAALLAGKISLAAGGLHLDLLDTFTLFGDPALTLDLNVVPFTERVYLPLLRR